MAYDINKLPDFYSVRNLEQLNNSLTGLEGKKCFTFFWNGFTSNVIEPNKRDMRFVWDGFLLFTDKDVTIEDIKEGIDLHDARLVALQRVNFRGDQANNKYVRDYIIGKLEEKQISYENMYDTNYVNGYPTQGKLWSTGEEAILIDAIYSVDAESAYYFNNTDFSFTINFNVSNLPSFEYNHNNTLILKGQGRRDIVHLLDNDMELQEKIAEIIGDDTAYSVLEGKKIPDVDSMKLAKTYKEQNDVNQN